MRSRPGRTLATEASPALGVNRKRQIGERFFVFSDCLPILNLCFLFSNDGGWRSARPGDERRRWDVLPEVYEAVTRNRAARVGESASFSDMAWCLASLTEVLIRADYYGDDKYRWVSFNSRVGNWFDGNWIDGLFIYLQSLWGTIRGDERDGTGRDGPFRPRDDRQEGPAHRPDALARPRVCEFHELGGAVQ